MSGVIWTATVDGSSGGMRIQCIASCVSPLTCMRRCMHARGVAKGSRKVDLQIRGVPLELRRRLAKRAASKGLSMSRYVITMIEDEVDRPATINEWLDELHRRRGPARDLGFTGGEVVREMRDAEERGEAI